MQHVSNISILIMYIMYFLAALFGYLTFYSKCNDLRFAFYSNGCTLGVKNYYHLHVPKSYKLT